MLKFTLAVFSAVVATFSVAEAGVVGRGGQESHGGGAVVCYADPARTFPVTVEVYDLYEGRIRYGYTRPAPVRRKTVEGYLAAVYGRLKHETRDPHLAGLVKKYVSYVRARLVAVDDLAFVPDVVPSVKEPSCEYRQLAVWNDRAGKVWIRKDLRARLDARQMAALLVHEALYFLYRDLLGPGDSEESRKFVAQLFSDVPLDDRLLLNFLMERRYRVPPGLTSGRTDDGRPAYRDTYGFRGGFADEVMRVTLVRGDVELAWGEAIRIQGELPLGGVRDEKVLAEFRGRFRRLEAGMTLEIPLRAPHLETFAAGASTLVAPSLKIFFFSQAPFTVRIEPKFGPGVSEWSYDRREPTKDVLGRPWNHVRAYTLDLVRVSR